MAYKLVVGRYSGTHGFAYLLPDTISQNSAEWIANRVEHQEGEGTIIVDSYILEYEYDVPVGGQHKYFLVAASSTPVFLTTNFIVSDFWVQEYISETLLLGNGCSFTYLDPYCCNPVPKKHNGSILPMLFGVIIIVFSLWNPNNYLPFDIRLILGSIGGILFFVALQLKQTTAV